MQKYRLIVAPPHHPKHLDLIPACDDCAGLVSSRVRNSLQDTLLQLRKFHELGQKLAGSARERGFDVIAVAIGRDHKHRQVRLPRFHHGAGTPPRMPACTPSRRRTATVSRYPSVSE